MPKTIEIAYEFKFADQRQRKIAAVLDFDTLALVNKPADPLPEWTLLAFHKCAGCPLSSAESPHCPAAVALVELIDFCNDMVSFEEVDVTVTTEARTYSKHTTMEEAVGSLLGLYMCTSGCPVMKHLRPLVDMHLPFVTPSEAIYRMAAMYMMGKYFQQKSGKTWNGISTDWSEFLKRSRKLTRTFFSA